MTMFEPVLKYVVEAEAGLIMFNDDGKKIGYVSGLTAWAVPNCQFQCHLDADRAAKKHGGKVVKIRITPKVEKIGK